AEATQRQCDGWPVVGHTKHAGWRIDVPVSPDTQLDKQFSGTRAALLPLPLGCGVGEAAGELDDGGALLAHAAPPICRGRSMPERRPLRVVRSASRAGRPACMAASTRASNVARSSSRPAPTN